MNPMETFDVFPSTTVPLSEEIQDAEDGRGSNVISRIATCSSDRVRMDRDSASLPFSYSLHLCTVLSLFRHSFSRDRTEIRNLQSFFAEEQAIGYWIGLGEGTLFSIQSAAPPKLTKLSSGLVNQPHRDGHRQEGGRQRGGGDGWNQELWLQKRAHSSSSALFFSLFLQELVTDPSDPTKVAKK